MKKASINKTLISKNTDFFSMTPKRAFHIQITNKLNLNECENPMIFHPFLFFNYEPT